MPVQFQENSNNNPDPTKGRTCQDDNPSGTSARHAPAGFADQNGYYGDEKEDRYAEVPIPVLHWKENEKNAFHQEFFAEAERDCLKIHESLRFWKDDVEAQPLAPIYGLDEAAWIIQNSDLLNKEQCTAVLACIDDLILHALAGTGKTRSLSSMIAYLVARGVKPGKIGVSSHTVTAAQEIKGRVEPMVAALFPKINESREPGYHNWIQAGTIHALSYRELGHMRHPRARHAIIEESNQIKLWKEACQFALGPEFNPEEDGLFYEWMRLHERIRGMAIPEHRVPQILESITGSNRLPKIAAIYHKIKEARDLLDYTDLLRLWIPILLHPGYKHRWEYFFVDEYQDTSPLQKFILKILRFQGVKVIVCGDIRQSITSFTGSDPSIGEPLETLPGPKPAKELWLQVNYRCSREVIALSNQILQQMIPTETHRLSSWHGAPLGKPPKIIHSGDKSMEYKTTVAEGVGLFESLQQTLDKKNPSVALLYRTNSQGSKLEEQIAETNSRLAKHGHPPITYTRKDSRKTALRNRTERELTAILYAWCNPQKARWFEILTSPYFKGIGEVTANTITTKAARKKPKEISDVWSILEGEIPRKSIETVGKFLAAWEECAMEAVEGDLEAIPTEKAVESLKRWIKSTLESQNGRESAESVSKKEIEESQRRSYEAGFLDKVNQQGETPLKAGLQNLEEDSKKEDEESEGADSAGGIILSTIHLSKGKEFDGVVLHNVSWYSLPHYNAIQQEELQDGILERRWRKLCSLEAENPGEEEGLIENLLKSPESNLPNIVPYPKNAVWGKSQQEAERDGDDILPTTKDHSTNWDWMTNPIEEEKRLLYVGVTRARQELVITTRSDKSHPFIPAQTWWKLHDGESIAQDSEREPSPEEMPGDTPF